MRERGEPLLMCCHRREGTKTRRRAGAANRRRIGASIDALTFSKLRTKTHGSKKSKTFTTRRSSPGGGGMLLRRLGHVAHAPKLARERWRDANTRVCSETNWPNDIALHARARDAAKLVAPAYLCGMCCRACRTMGGSGEDKSTRLPAGRPAVQPPGRPRPADRPSDSSSDRPFVRQIDCRIAPTDQSGVKPQPKLRR